MEDHIVGDSSSTDNAFDERSLVVTIAEDVSVVDGEQPTFTINTETTLTSFSASTLSVKRIYSDFEWLHAALIAYAKRTGVVVPCLPEKPRPPNTGRLSRFMNKSDNLSQSRRNLEAFLQSCAIHRMHRISHALRDFLEVSDISTIIRESCLDQTIRDNTTDSLIMRAKAAVNDVRLGRVKENDEFFDCQKIFIVDCSNRCKETSKAVQVVSKARLKFAESSFDLGSRAVANGNEQANRKLACIWSTLGDGLQLAQNSHNHIADEEEKVIGLFDLYQRDCKAIQDMLLERIRAIGESEAAQKAVVKAEKAKISTKLPEAEKELSAAVARCDTLTDAARLELGLFSAQRIRNFKRCISDAVKMQIHYEKEHALAWKQLLADVDVI